jgi:hypothetical protein
MRHSGSVASVPHGEGVPTQVAAAIPESTGPASMSPASSREASVVPASASVGPGPQPANAVKEPSASKKKAGLIRVIARVWSDLVRRRKRATHGGARSDWRLDCARLTRSFALRLAITIAISALLAVAIALAVPHLARSRAETMLTDRLGTPVTIADASVGWSAVELHDLRIEGTGAHVQLALVRAEASLFGLALDGSSAVHGIAVTRGDVSLDLTSELVRRWATRESEPASTPSDGTPRPARTLSLDGVRVTVLDGVEPLLTATDTSAQWDGASLRFVAHEVSIGPNTAGLVELEGSRIDGVILASRVHVADVSVSADDVEGPTPLSRLRAAVRALRPDAATDATEGEEGEGAVPSIADRLDVIERHLEPAFAFEVERVTIHRTIDGQPRDVVADARASLVRIGGGGYHTQGEGSPDGGGSLAWNLDVAPRVPSASGTVTLDRVALVTFVPFLPPIPFYEPEHATLSGHLALDAQDVGETVHAEGTLAVENLALEHTRLAPSPVRGITFQLRGTADFTPVARRLVVPTLALAMGGAEATLHGTFEWTEDHYLFDFGASLPRTSCDAAVHAIPRDLLAETAGFRLSGNIAASIDAAIDSRALDETTLRIHVANACEFTAFPEMADVARFLGPFVHRVEEPDESVFEMETGPGTSEWTSISEISPFLVHAVLGHEDSSFFTHSGFAPWAIRDALVRNLRAGRYVLGASTITMQLVKNVFLHREKTLARKIQEVLLTWWIESAMEKERILELYLNVIEYGPAVYGIRHAAEHYFGRAPSELSPAESAYLALILPNPPAFHEQYEQGEIPRAFRGRIASFVRILGSRGRYDDAAVAAGVAEAETLSFHREGDPPPAPRTLEGAVAPLPITFFSTVPVGQVAVVDDESDGAPDGDEQLEEDEEFVDPWDEL